MHAKKVLHKWLSDVLPWMHETRKKSLEASISGALIGGRLTVTGLGRSIPSDAREKHKIKRADRLLSNKNLQLESLNVYASLSKEIIGEAKQPLILIDWSDVDERRKFFLLRAAVPVQGRSLTIYEEVHEFSTKEKPKTHQNFLNCLKQILPKDCKPIVVTDAGFRTPWFKQVQALGWDFIGRVRNVEKIKLNNNGWIATKSLHKQATNKASFLGEGLLTESNQLSCRFVLFKAKPKGRICKTKMGFKARSRRSLHNSVRSKEPWLLATSLFVAATTAKKIINLYRTRMQIEEAFRDLKCTRFGLSLYLNGTYKLCRLRVLILIGALANLFSWTLGKAAQGAGLHKQFQANTESRYHVLSAVFLGVQIFRDNRVHLQLRSSLNIGNFLNRIFSLYRYQ